MIPLNFAPEGSFCDYINTGLWATKAFQEAGICGAKARLAASSEDKNFTYIPDAFDFDSKAKYVYLTSNNTVRGTQWKEFPQNAPAPLIADMSSEFLSRPVNLDKFVMIHAGAQKNVGPAGLTIVVIREEFVSQGKKGLPHMLDYHTYLEHDSMYNTPPVFAIYVAGLIFKWLLKEVGGLKKMEEINLAKAGFLYGAIDNSGGFYKGTALTDSRSTMNVTFRLANTDLEKPFLEKAAQNGLAGLGGHRSVGGIRASLYNAVSLTEVKVLVDFMEEFKKKNG
jgi:phosphoserine aminotransferase